MITRGGGGKICLKFDDVTCERPLSHSPGQSVREPAEPTPHLMELGRFRSDQTMLGFASFFFIFVDTT